MISRKFFVSLAIILSIIFSFTLSLASNDNMINDATNGMKDFINGVKDTTENVTGSITNTSKNLTGDMENGLMGYNTQRVSTEDNVMGMNSNTLSWIIIAVATIAIVALIWYYLTQFNHTNSNHKHHNDYYE